MPTFITPTLVSPASFDEWSDIDCSAIIPAGATGVILHIHNYDAGSVDLGLRKNGSTDNRTAAQAAGHHGWAAIGVDANRVFEVYTETACDVDFYIVGYFTSAEAYFFTNAVDKSLVDITAWTDIDISADTGAATATGVIFEVIAVSLEYGFRKNGSTDDRHSAGRRHHWFIVGVDGSEICEGYVESTDVDFYLVGYIKASATFNTNATDVSLGGTGAWTNLTSLGAGAVGAVIEVVAGANNYGLREDGSAEDIYGVGRHNIAIVEAASQIIEGEISSTDVDFFIIAEFAASPSSSIGWKFKRREMTGGLSE